LFVCSLSLGIKTQRSFEFRTKIILRKGPHLPPKDSNHKEKAKISRAASNNYEKKSKSAISEESKFKSKSPRSTDLHLPSIGMISVHPEKKSNLMPTRPPPPPPLPALQQQTHKYQKTTTLNKGSLLLYSKKFEHKLFRKVPNAAD
jgi:hypothetical protein